MPFHFLPQRRHGIRVHPRSKLTQFIARPALTRPGTGDRKTVREHKTFIFLLNNWGVLSRDIVRTFGTPILKGIKVSKRTKTNHSSKSNLSMEKLWREVDIARKRGYAWPSRYYRLINRKRIGEAIFLEMENVMSIITDHIKYLEAQQLRNMKASSDRSPTW